MKMSPCWIGLGFVAIGLQQCWVRLFAGWLPGSSTLPTLVLAGLALGIVAGARLARRGEGGDGAPVLGRTLLGISLAGLPGLLLASLPASVWTVFPYEDQGGVLVPPASRDLLRTFLVVISVTPVGALWGAAFVRLSEAGSAGSSTPAGLLGGGAAGGTLAIVVLQAAAFPTVGHTTSALLLILLSLLLGIVALLRRAPPGAADRSEDAIPPGGLSGSVCITLLTGFLLGGLVSDLQEKLDFIGTGSSLGRPLVIAWGLAALHLAARAATGIPVPDRRRVMTLLVLGCVLHAVTWEYAYMVRDWLAVCDVRPADWPFTPREYQRAYFPTRTWQLPVLVGFLVFPPVFFTAGALPWVLDRARSMGGFRPAVALLAASFAAGVLVFGLAAPRVDAFYAFKLHTAFLAIGCVGLVLAGDRPRPWLPALVAAAMALAVELVPAGFDVTFVNPKSRAANHPVLALRSDGGDTTFVVDDPDGRRLNVENYCTSAAFPTTAQYLRLLAHLPLLFHPRPEKALVLGFGCGIGSAAIALHPTITAIDVVERNPRIRETAPEFTAANSGVFRDPRVTFVQDDPRHFLAGASSRYDVITVNMPPPMMAGIHRLYSVEHYRAALGALTERGLASQWVPLDQLSPEATERVMRTFLEVFPRALCFVGHDRNLILVGGRSELDVTEVERKLAAGGPVLEDLRALGIRGAVALLARALASDCQLRRSLGDGPTIVDARNDLDHLLKHAWQHSVVPYDPWGLMADMRVERLAEGERLRGAMTHLGRLVYRVPDFPLTSLIAVRHGPGTPVALAGLDWMEHYELVRISRIQLDEEDVRGRFRALLELTRLSPELPWAQLELARLRAGQEDREGALHHIGLFQDIEPDDLDGTLLRSSLQAIP